MIKRIQIILSFLFCYCTASTQNFWAVPRTFFHQTPLLNFGDILRTSTGRVLIASSKELFEESSEMIQIACSYPPHINEKGSVNFLGKNSNIVRDLVESVPGIKLLCQAPDTSVYIVTNNNNIGWINYKQDGCIRHPPFNFQDSAHKKVITKIWVDADGVLFIATDTDVVYYIENATKVFEANTQDKKFAYEYGLSEDSNYVVMKGARPIKNFSLGKGIIAHSFLSMPENSQRVLIGTNEGLFAYDKGTGTNMNYFKTVPDSKCTITNIEVAKPFTFWFSTLEKGMGRFDIIPNKVEFFKYPKINATANSKYPIQTFTRKSFNEFFVAIADSLPAIFNTDTGKYVFINDTVFHQTENNTTDIEVDGLGNLFVSKGNGFFMTQLSLLGASFMSTTDSSLIGPYINDIMLGSEKYESRHEFDGRFESLKEINLKYHENDLTIRFSCRGVSLDSLIFAWKVNNQGNEWIEKEFSPFGDYINGISLNDLSPGKYELRIRCKKLGGNWLPNEATLIINIQAAYWRTWWFWTAIIGGLILIIYLIIKWRVNIVRKEERLKAQHEKEILELEAKALRAQMNPHFIFNCLNSIKVVIQKDEKDKAVNYLVIFSKLIRTIFQNSGKREITLFDEIETCRLYTELESLRFDSRLSFTFSVDETIDLKSVMVPALIIQPFIENAIWHGLTPKQNGGILDVSVSRKNDQVFCVIDDDGIGRKVSLQNKSNIDNLHNSQGVRLTQTRLELSNSINQRNATVEIMDKVDSLGEPTGTRVILNFSIA